MNEHDELRQKYRKHRAGLSPQRLERAASDLMSRLLDLPQYQQAQRIAAYFAVNGEISLQPLIEQALKQDKQIFLPILDQQALKFAAYFETQKMRLNRFRLPEPDVSSEQLLAPTELDLVLAPLVVFDAACNRIGMGGGYYDRSFEFRKNSSTSSPVLVGVAHDSQKVDQIDAMGWDVRLDMVVTDRAIYR